MSTKRARAESHTPSSKQRAPHSGSSLTSQHGAAIALAEASLGKALSSALGANITRGLVADIRIEGLISADLQRLKGVAAGIDALQTMNPFLEAERDRWKQLAEIANPCKGVLEGLQMQSIRFDSAAMIGTESLRRMAEDCAPRFSSFGIGLGSDAIGVLGSIGNLSAFGDLHAEMRIHAVPRLPSLPPPRLGRCPETLPDRPPRRSVPESPSRKAPASWLDDNLDEESGQRILEQLSGFVRSAEIPSDAREGMSVLITWWKLNRLRITPNKSLEFNRSVQRFIGVQLGLTTSPDDHNQLNCGLLMPRGEGRQQLPTIELDPHNYTSLELSAILNYGDSTIRRQAKTAWTKAGGLGPCPLRKDSNWYVVEAAEDGGGQKRGWKFQQCQNSKEA